MKLCKSVYIDGDYQNGFSIGVKKIDFIPTKIEERITEGRDRIIDREYLIWEGDKMIASISNIPVLVYYLKDTK